MFKTRSLVVGCTLLATIGCSTTRSTGQLNLPGPNSTASVQVRGQNPSESSVLGALDPKATLSKLRDAAGYGPDKSIAEAAFREAEEKFVAACKLKQGRRDAFEEAGKLYKKAAARWPNSTLQEDALFMLSECYFFADRYPQASQTYEELVDLFPNTRHMDSVDKRRFAMAQYWVEHHRSNPDFAIKPNIGVKELPTFDKFGHGVRVFNKIRLDDPTGQLADDATMAAAMAHFKENHFGLADELFSDLRQSFPDSQHQFQAHLLGLQCKMKLYQGPDYSTHPLDEAEKLLKQIARLFPEEAEKHKEYLNETWKQMRLKKAQHDFGMATYYHRRKEYSAARHYYEQVMRKYSDTSLSEDAEQALSTLRDEPERPEQRLPWLVRMFPTPEREKPLVVRNPLDTLRR